MDSTLIDAEDLRSQLIDSLGLTNLPQAEQEEMLHKISSAVMARVSISIMSRLTEEQIDESNKLMDIGDADGLRRYMHNTIPAFDEFVQTETSRAIVDYQKLLILTAGDGSREGQ